jgi:alkanesulfonate monooxygenase SsuD/methylene tetrahydromethanopterin reductase-like flavin-dependent oxidoreductase (luciferase family)
MELGTFMDLRNPAEWRVPWVDHYRRALDLAVEAEHLGAESVWFSEHHNFDDGYLPQPLTFAAAVAARTTRIRLGTAIVLAPLRHPQHLAEEAAIVDLVSDGRVELGIGAGYGAREFQAFGKDISARFGATDAMYVELRRLLDDDGVTPPPVQRPFPIWLGYQGPKGARRAGRLGARLLSFRRENYQPYLDGLAEGGHDPATAKMGGLINIMVADDPERTLERLLPHYAHMINTYGALHASDGGAAPDPMTVERLRAQIKPPGRVLDLRVLTPEAAVTEILEQTAGLPVVRVYLWASLCAMPDDIVQRHLELAFAQVAPALKSATESSSTT